jgi:hypothetical protein
MCHIRNDTERLDKAKARIWQVPSNIRIYFR